ncbi:MAG: hypothetical protein ACKPKO_29495 [Candidatus Fonsibacter sp.]
MEPGADTLTEWAIEFITSGGQGFHPLTACAVKWDHDIEKTYSYNAGALINIDDRVPLFDIAFASTASNLEVAQRAEDVLQKVTVNFLTQCKKAG